MLFLIVPSKKAIQDALFVYASGLPGNLMGTF